MTPNIDKYLDHILNVKKYNKHVIYVNFLTYEFRARGILSLVSFTAVV